MENCAGAAFVSKKWFLSSILITLTFLVGACSESADSALVGTWLLDEGNGNVNVLVFLDDMNYIIGHTENQETDPTLGVAIAASVEYGTYSWDEVSGALNISINGSGQLVLNDNGTDIVLDPVETELDPLLGSWVVADNVLVFIDSSNYIIMHQNNAELDATLNATVAASAEEGTYTWNSSTGDFSVMVFYVVADTKRNQTPNLDDL